MEYRTYILVAILLILIAALILIFRKRDKAREADMHLPASLLALAAFLFIVSIGALIYGAFIRDASWIPALCVSPVLMVLGIAACLCWKNQKIRILSDAEFQYTTFLGNERKYRFDAITGVRRNADSFTIYVGGDKVHVESMAVVSAALRRQLEEALS